MISRFFKRSPKKAVKKPAPKAAAPKATPKPKAQHKAPMKPVKKILTAEGWKRLMMRSSSKGKK